ncbi:MAG: hypothetical protein PHR35_06520, partial [Kiritimatiellae bacterium]|nr:hypothetical protein [Kiritimatiellia bacterium]
MKKTFGVGFCGAGGIVRGNHVPAIEASDGRFRVVGFYDVAPERAAAMAGAKHKAYGGYEEM